MRPWLRLLTSPILAANVRHKEMNTSRTCKMGVVGVLLASLFPTLVILRIGKVMPLMVEPLLKYSIILGPISAILLGVTTLVRIKTSEGRLKGKGYAWVSISIGAAQLLIMIAGILSFLHMMSGGKLAK